MEGKVFEAKAVGQGWKIFAEVPFSQCLKTQKEDKKIANGWNVDFLYYYDIF